MVLSNGDVVYSFEHSVSPEIAQHRSTEHILYIYDVLEMGETGQDSKER
jgi:hypothetical protein